MQILNKENLKKAITILDAKITCYHYEGKALTKVRMQRNVCEFLLRQIIDYQVKSIRTVAYVLKEIRESRTLEEKLEFNYEH